MYKYIYIYRRANGIYIKKKVAAYGQFVLVMLKTDMLEFLVLFFLSKF